MSVTTFSFMFDGKYFVVRMIITTFTVKLVMFGKFFEYWNLFPEFMKFSYVKVILFALQSCIAATLNTSIVISDLF